MVWTFNNFMQWPEELLPIFQKALTCEYASLTKEGVPITYPCTPYLGVIGRTLDVSTGLTYPAKAERARRNPKVCLLFSDPVGSGLTNPPAALVIGLAAVRDEDLQANTDRYVRETIAKNGKFAPDFILKRMGWYFARIWIEVAVQRILWWPGGDFDQPPQEWNAKPDLMVAVSNGPAEGKQPPRWKEAPIDWRAPADYAQQNLGAPILTVVNPEGYPMAYRVKRSTRDPLGFRLEIPKGAPTLHKAQLA